MLVPNGAPAGDYTGSIEVIGGGGQLAEIPVRVTVHGFSIPSTSTLRSAFHITNEALPGGDPTLYAAMALNNRVTLSNLWPFPESRFVAKILPLLEGTDPRVQLPGAKLTALDAYHCATNCLAPWRDLARKYPVIANRFFDYICDEPSSTRGMERLQRHRRKRRVDLAGSAKAGHHRHSKYAVLGHRSFAPCQRHGPRRPGFLRRLARWGRSTEPLAVHLLPKLLLQQLRVLCL